MPSRPRKISQKAARRAPDGEYAKRNAVRATEGRGDRQDEFAQRTAARAVEGRGDRANEFGARAVQRQDQDRAQEFGARNAARANEDRAPEYAERTAARRAATVTDVVARAIAQNTLRVDNEIIATQMQAEANFFAPIEEELPLDSAENCAVYHSAKTVKRRFWQHHAPAPHEVTEPTPDDKEFWFDDAAARKEFHESVHKADAVCCAWCGEISVTTFGEFGVYSIADPKLVKCNDPRPHAPQATPPAAHPDLEERDRAKGYIKRLVNDHGPRHGPSIVVCSTCKFQIDHEASNAVWQTAIDFGTIPDELKGLSAAESAFIALGHPLARVIKLRSSNISGAATTFHGHTIVFEHNSDEVFNTRAAELGALTDLEQLFVVHFIGPKGSATTVGGHMHSGVLEVRGRRIVEALRYLKASNTLYDRISAEAIEAAGNVAEQQVANIIENMHVTDTDEKNRPNQSLKDRAVVAIAARATALEQPEVSEPLPDNTLLMQGAVNIAQPPTNSSADPEAVLKWVTKQTETPINEFDNNKLLFNSSFPHLLPTGSFPCDCFPSQDMLRHLLLYWDSRFQNESTFVMVLDNQRMRHGMVRNNARVNKADADATVAELRKDDFIGRLSGAIQANKNKALLTPEQNQVLNFVRQTFCVATRKIAFTEGDRRPGMFNIMALSRCYGPPSFMVTMSPSLVDNSLGVRLCIPGTDAFYNGTNFNYMNGAIAHDNTIANFSYDMRSRRVFECPASSALFFKHFKECVLSILLGVDTDVKTSAHFNRWGALGRVNQYFSATEVQGRTLLHFHMLLWTEHSPAYLTDLGQRDLDASIQIFQNYVCTHLSDRYYEQREKQWANMEFTVPAALCFRDSQAETEYASIAMTQHHYQHKDTCAKGAEKKILKAGAKITCRLGFPRPPSEKACFVLIKSLATADQKPEIKMLDQQEVQALLPCQHFSCGCRDILAFQLVPPIVFADMRRFTFGTASSDARDPQTNLPLRTITLPRDQALSEFNRMLLTTCSCNQNVSQVTTVEHATAAAGYLGEYATKDDGSFAASTETIIAALDDDKSKSKNNTGCAAAASAAAAPQEAPAGTVAGGGASCATDAALSRRVASASAAPRKASAAAAAPPVEMRFEDVAPPPAAAAAEPMMEWIPFEDVAPPPPAAAAQEAAAPPVGGPPSRRVLNRLAMKHSGARETASTMAAYAMLGGKRYDTGASFFTVKPWELIKAMPQDLRRAPGDANAEGGSADEAENSESDDAEGIFDAVRGGGNADIFLAMVNPDDRMRIEGEEGPDQVEVLLGDTLDKVTAESQWVDYRLRPAALETMSAIEFFCCTEIERKPMKKQQADGAGGGAMASVEAQETNDADEDGGEEGRVKNPRHEFLDSHPRKDDFKCKIKSKYAYPSLAGARPPTLPTDNDLDTQSLRQQCHTWAIYWRILIAPWRHDREWQATSYEEMNEFVNTSRLSKDYATRSAAYFVYRCTRGFSVSAMNKKLFNAYRFAWADKISGGNAGAANADGEKGHDEDSEALEFARLFEALDKLDVLAEGSAHTVAETCRAQYEQVFGAAAGVFGQAADGAQVAAAAAGGADANDKDESFGPQLLTDADNRRLRDTNNRLDKYVPPAENADIDGDSRMNDHEDFGQMNDDLPRDIEQPMADRLLNDEQKAFVRRVISAVRGTSQERLFWLFGAAGCGKTFATRVLMDLVRAENNGLRGSVAACAYQGKAAANLELGAMTMHRLFSLPNDRQGAAEAKQPAELTSTYQNAKLFVIEEISMVSAEVLEIVDAQMKKAYDDERPFGGKVVLALGDFLQLPPVKGTRLTTAAMKPAGKTYSGGILWRDAIRICLTTVVRAQGCPVQLTRLRQLREQMTFPKSVYNGIKTLSAQEVAQDETWRHHSSLHATNEARNNVGTLHLSGSAGALGKPFYKWRKPASGEAAKALPADRLEKVYSMSEAWGQFVHGEQFMLLENRCVSAGLTNGAIGTAHAIFFSAVDFGKVRAAEDKARSENTCVAELPVGVAPKFIEIAFEAPAAVESQFARDPNSVPGRIENGRWIVALASQTLDPLEIAKSKSTIALSGFAITQARSLTFHKSQGLTIPKLVLDFSKVKGRRGCNVSFESVYVGISRAPTDSDLRVLPLQPGQDIDYLFGKNGAGKLRPHEDTLAYLSPASWPANYMPGRRAGFAPPPPQPAAKPPAKAAPAKAAAKKAMPANQAAKAAPAPKRKPAARQRSKQGKSDDDDGSDSDESEEGPRQPAPPAKMTKAKMKAKTNLPPMPRKVAPKPAKGGGKK
jgi:hypothetical protein